jgi:hypothetical protein
LKTCPQGLGWVEKRDITFEIRSANRDMPRLSAVAEEVVSLNPALIWTVSTPVALAAQRATSTIPIVFIAVSDPVIAREGVEAVIVSGDLLIANLRIGSTTSWPSQAITCGLPRGVVPTRPRNPELWGGHQRTPARLGRLTHLRSRFLTPSLDEHA